MRITAEWFDGDTPNPLHPVGWLIDPVRREVIVPVYVDGRVTAVLSDTVLRVGDEFDALGMVTHAGETPEEYDAYVERVRDRQRRAVADAKHNREPTLQEIWRD